MVSIIIINYNTFELTCSCIKSIIEQTLEVNYEIILVDNNSSEKTERTFDDVFENKIKFIASKTNLGFAGGNNLGISIALGEYILLLNSDTLLFEDSISKTVSFASKKNKVGAVTCKLLNSDLKSFQNAARPFISLKRHFLNTFNLNKLFPQLELETKEKYNLNATFSSDWIWGTFFLFPKRNLNLMGGKLTENFFMYSEDMEWSYIFYKNGLQNWYFSDTAIVHYGGQSSPTDKRMSAIQKSHLKFVRMYYGSLAAFVEWILFKIDFIFKRIKRYKRSIKRNLKMLLTNKSD